MVRLIRPLLEIPISVTLASVVQVPAVKELLQVVQLQEVEVAEPILVAWSTPKGEGLKTRPEVGKDPHHRIQPLVTKPLSEQEKSATHTRCQVPVLDDQAKDLRVEVR